MQLFDSRIELVLAAYNAGENAVLRYGQRIPPYRETQQYVPAVLARYREWREEPVLPAAVPAPPASNTCLARVSTLITCKLRATAEDIPARVAGAPPLFNELRP